MFLVP